MSKVISRKARSGRMRVMFMAYPFSYERSSSWVGPAHFCYLLQPTRLKQVTEVSRSHPGRRALVRKGVRHEQYTHSPTSRLSADHLAHLVCLLNLWNRGSSPCRSHRAQCRLE